MLPQRLANRNESIMLPLTTLAYFHAARKDDMSTEVSASDTMVSSS